MEILGGATSLLGAVTTVAVLVPPLTLGLEPQGSGWDGMLVLPLGMVGPALIDEAGQTWRRQLRQQGLPARSGPARILGLITLGAGGAVGVTGGVMSLYGERTGPWLQLAAVPLLLGSAGAFAAEAGRYRREWKAQTVSNLTVIAPGLWVGEGGGGLLLQGTW